MKHHNIPGIGMYPYISSPFFGPFHSDAIFNWKYWLSNWENLEPIMQQLHSFLLFCCEEKNKTLEGKGTLRVVGYGPFTYR